ncbi:hypothetical protein [Agromyces neolithicus]|uniref:Uncharacterized protein n=1 Tax=Agromyces neolithicus TaxID=269420 RepID=A0ABN2LXW7_9MICO
MNTALLSPGAGILSGWAVRGGLTLASWGLARAARRTDRDRLMRHIEARAAAEAALAERAALMKTAGYTMP